LALRRVHTTPPRLASRFDRGFNPKRHSPVTDYSSQWSLHFVCNSHYQYPRLVLVLLRIDHLLFPFDLTDQHIRLLTYNTSLPTFSLHASTSSQIPQYFRCDATTYVLVTFRSDARYYILWLHSISQVFTNELLSYSRASKASSCCQYSAYDVVYVILFTALLELTPVPYLLGFQRPLLMCVLPLHPRGLCYFGLHST
jgi:hypothetical protein